MLNNCFQPVDFFGYFTDGLKNEANQGSGYNQGQVQSPNPQTPSSIPEIVLTGLIKLKCEAHQLNKVIFKAWNRP